MRETTTVVEEKKLESVARALAAALVERNIEPFIVDHIVPSAHSVVWLAIAKLAEEQAYRYRD